MGVLKVDTIHPTHECFDDALGFMEKRVLEALRAAAPPPLHLILVHAICLMPAEQPNAGKLFVHAWVEEDDLCWDAGIANGTFRIVYAVERQEFYAHLRPQHVTKYTMKEAYEENKKSGHHGPWKDEYLPLCRKKSEANESSSEAPSLPTS